MRLGVPSPGALISSYELQTRAAISANQCQSMAISGNQWQSMHQWEPM